MGDSMYKITLYDYCCCPICDGTVSFFVDDLEDFEKNWKKLLNGRDKERVERFERSKNGEIVTDYYSDDEELNIVQRDENAKIMEEAEFEKSNFRIELFNAYSWSSEYYIFRLKYKLRKIFFKGKYYIIAKYNIKGIAEKYLFAFGDENKKYEDVSFYGNPVCNVTYSEKSQDYSSSPDVYQDDEIDSFVWHEIWKRDDDLTLDELNEEELQYLLRDIIGEGG